MNNFRKFSLLSMLLLFISCEPSPDEMIPYVQGYWEIKDVKKNNEIIMEYSMSPIIDFWQINEELSGFRKKVMPNLEGKFKITQHSIPVQLKTENGQLIVHYNDNDNTFKETILAADSTELVIVNEEGLIYTYRPYQQISIDND